MKTKSPSALLCALFLPLAAASVASAADYYLQADMLSSTGFTSLSVWGSEQVGSPGHPGTAPTTLNDNDFWSDGFAVRTGTTSSSFGNAATTFHLQSDFTVRTGGTALTTINNMITYQNPRVSGGPRIGFGVTNAAVSVVNFTNNVSTELGTVTTGRTASLGVGTLTGAGDLVIQAASNFTLLLSVTDATAFTGDIVFGNGTNTTLNFDSTFVSGGGLTALSTSRINLDQNVTFTSVMIAGTTLTETRTYTFTELNTMFNDVFIEGGSGSITLAAIPEPSSYAALIGLAALAGVTFRRRTAIRSRRDLFGSC